jgi:hypothetical protein
LRLNPASRQEGAPASVAADPYGQEHSKEGHEVTMRSKIAIILCISAMVMGCQQHGNPVAGAPSVASADASPNDAIRTAIQAHLAHNGNLSLNSFDTEVKQVNLDGDHAQAQVEFHVKNGPGTMQLTYALAKHDGAWSVVESTPAGSNFSHPALDKSQVPATGGPMGDGPDVFRALDNFHGGAAAAQQKLPPGHPPVAASPKPANP